MISEIYFWVSMWGVYPTRKLKHKTSNFDENHNVCHKIINIFVCNHWKRIWLNRASVSSFKKTGASRYRFMLCMDSCSLSLGFSTRLTSQHLINICDGHLRMGDKSRPFVINTQLLRILGTLYDQDNFLTIRVVCAKM